MTALAGVWALDGRPGAEPSCQRVLKAQELYGPHGTRLWSDGDLAMGRSLFHTLPEDRFDRQPLVSRDLSLTLVADVRIDNRDELAGALGLARIAAERLSDADFLLASLERWGEGALDRLVGDFAFALWNAQSRTLWLGRDFAGQRPLHYHRSQKQFAFASMPKGLHALPEVPYAADAQAMAEFVALIPEGGGRSFFEGIEVVEPGRLVTVRRDGLTVRRFWSPTRDSLGAERREDFVEGLRHHLDQATAARLRGAGGTVAAQLSGGLDSAAVTATAARLLAAENGRVVAFTAVPREGYREAAPENRIADEGPLAAATAGLYTNIEHRLIRAGDRSPLQGADRSFYLYDRPTLNLCNAGWTDAINAAAQARGLTVMLTGQMGNATLSYAGTELLPELWRTGRIAALGRVARQLLARRSMRLRGILVATLGPSVPVPLWRGLNRMRGLSLDIGDYSALNDAALADGTLARLACDRGLDLSYRPRRDGFEARTWLFGRTALGNYNKGILGGWGIDQRDPTADRRLVDYCLGVPMSEFLKGGELRALGRAALRDRLPAAVLDERRRGYQGADWHVGFGLARAEIAAELDRIGACDTAARLLDLPRLARLMADVPETGWDHAAVLNAYRYALLRGVSAGHFLRKAGGINR